MHPNTNSTTYASQMTLLIINREASSMWTQLRVEPTVNFYINTTLKSTKSSQELSMPHAYEIQILYHQRELVQSRNILLASANLLKSTASQVYPTTYEIILFHFSQLNLKDKLVA